MSLPANFTVNQKLPTGARDRDLGDASNDVSGQQEASAAGLSGTFPTELFRGYFLSAASGPIAFGVSQDLSTSLASAPAQTAALSLATSAKPSWISQLSTSSIATDMSAAIVNGQVTYSGLLTLLKDVDSKVTSAGLTTAQFNDLKTIVANLNNGVTTSAYLTGIMKSLVMGNTMNATWTGGGSSSATLGNLAAGSSATKLSELIGKWFLGTDLPNSKVSMSGVSSFSVTYSNSSKPVFAAAGPSMNDINQGYLGDCYLLSCLAEVAYKNPNVISSMITSNGNSSYGVRFYISGTTQYVTVNTSLANGGSIFNSGTDIWASLVEKGYAQLQAGGVYTGNSVNYGNSWSTIGNGGAPESALEEITNSPIISDFRASGSAWTSVTYNSSMATIGYSTGNATAAIQNTLISDLAAGDDVILSSRTNARDGSGKTTLVASHAMSIYGFDSATRMFEIRNPWGTASGQSWDTTFEVGLSTLLAAGDTITADAIGGSKAISAPRIAAQTATQTWEPGQAVAFTLAANTFIDTQGQALTYTATQADGSSLPSWLKFNSATDTFTGTASTTAKGLSIKVTATDTGGLSSSETFAVVTPAAITRAAHTFTNPNETPSHAATQANDSAMPSSFTFSAIKRFFTGSAPNAATALGVGGAAPDNGSFSASETLHVTASAAALTHAIARNNDTPAPAIVNQIKPVHGDAHHVFGPRV